MLNRIYEHPQIWEIEIDVDGFLAQSDNESLEEDEGEW